MKKYSFPPIWHAQCLWNVSVFCAIFSFRVVLNYTKKGKLNKYLEKAQRSGAASISNYRRNDMLCQQSLVIKKRDHLVGYNNERE